jgi:hypothetical protein
MRLRKVIAVAGAAVGSAAGAVALRRRAARRRDRVELYFADGSLVTLTRGSPEAEPLLAPARRVLETARA